jgi:hypothetical protein
MAGAAHPDELRSPVRLTETKKLVIISLLCCNRVETFDCACSLLFKNQQPISVGAWMSKCSTA